MADESSERRVIIAILLTSTLLTMLGLMGVLMGSNDLVSGPLPENIQPEDLPDLLQSEEAQEEQIRFLEVQATNPYRRPMAAANVVVSGLVLIGSFLLSWRRKLAQWWIKQAVTAKLIWIIAYTASLVYHLNLVFPSLPRTSPDGGATLEELITTVVLGSIVSAGLHLAAAWRATRPDIRKFIEGAAKS